MRMLEHRGWTWVTQEDTDFGFLCSVNWTCARQHNRMRGDSSFPHACVSGYILFASTPNCDRSFMSFPKRLSHRLNHGSGVLIPSTYANRPTKIGMIQLRQAYETLRRLGIRHLQLISRYNITTQTMHLNQMRHVQWNMAPFNSAKRSPYLHSAVATGFDSPDGPRTGSQASEGRQGRTCSIGASIKLTGAAIRRCGCTISRATEHGDCCQTPIAVTGCLVTSSESIGTMAQYIGELSFDRSVLYIQQTLQ